jgi:hypothetical protein
MKLSDLMPDIDADGEPMLKVFRIPAKVGICEDRRYGVMIAISLDGKTFLPTSASPDFDPKKHILIPKSYPYFTATGLPRESHILLDHPQKDVKGHVDMIGWLRGPLVAEVIKRSPIPVTTIKKSNPPRQVYVWIRPWAFDDSVAPQIDEQKAMVEVYDEVVTRLSKVPAGEARYRDGRIAVNSNTPPQFEQWVSACTEYLYDTIPVDSGTRRAMKKWQHIVMRHPLAARNLLITRMTNTYPTPDEIPDEDINRMVLAEAASSVIARDGCGVPDKMKEFISDNLDGNFRVLANWS